MFDRKNDFLVEKKLMPRNLFSSAVGFIVHSFSSQFGCSRMGLTRLRGVVIKCIQAISKIIPSAFGSALVKPLRYLYQNYLTIDISEEVPCFLLNEFKELEFSGVIYTVPLKSEDYLAFRYGKDWRKPIKNWVTARDDGAYLYNKVNNV